MKDAKFKPLQIVYFDGERKIVEEVEWWQSTSQYYYHIKGDDPTVWISERELQEKRMDLSFVDISEPSDVQILISDDGKTVWVNVDGVCRFRACRIPTLTIDDQRKKENPNGIREGETAVLRSKRPSVVKTRVRNRAPKNVS